MFFDKKKYIIEIQAAKGIETTASMRGLVQHLMVRPYTEDTEWDMVILDKDKDELYEITNHVGRLDDYRGFPLGTDAQEKVTIKFSNVSKNEPIKVIFRTRELD